MNNFEILLVALALDALLGEPAWLWSRLPHPVSLMGQAVGYCDRRFNNGQRRNGVLVIFSLVLAAGLLGFLIQIIPDFGILETAVVAVLIAQRSLVDHVGAVAGGLAQDLEKGKKAVGLIVGRDTTDMDKSAVARAAIESASENFSDGVIAPALWFLLLGLPGLLIYKIINTADSMIAYRSPKYLHFGWATAKLDDLINLAPARLSGLLICIASGAGLAWKVMQRDARQHRSPNAGWPEAAMAGALDISLAGPRSYDGKMSDDLFVHPSGRRDLGPHEIEQSVKVLWRAWLVFGLIVLALAVII